MTVREVPTKPTGLRSDLVRALAPAPLLRAAEKNAARVMNGHFAVFNQWTEIDSFWEGRFMEMFTPGAFKKTITEGQDRMRVLYQHGRDASTGMKPLGKIDTLREDETGAYYEVPLFDTQYVRELIPALENGQLGASFQFDSLREEWNQAPKRSATNPEGLPERTVKEARVPEFGPVTFGAYPAASSGIMRSLTDEYRADAIAGDPVALRAYDAFLKSRIAPSPLVAARKRTSGTTAVISRTDFIALLNKSARE